MKKRDKNLENGGTSDRKKKGKSNETQTRGFHQQTTNHSPSSISRNGRQKYIS